MKVRKWLIFFVALAMIGATAAAIVKIKGRRVYGDPGVRVVNVPSYDPDLKPVRTNSVFLPERIFGAQSQIAPISRAELDGLPQDTTFGRRHYIFQDQAQVTATVVLMGTDRSSIHQPQFCLTGQGWSIDRTEQETLQINRPYLYDLPVMKLTTSIHFRNQQGDPITMHGVYVYWFVAKDKLSAGQGERMWSQLRTLLSKGELERWAYVSFFCTCEPGREDAAYERLANMISESVPEFQTASGPRKNAAVTSR